MPKDPKDPDDPNNPPLAVADLFPFDELSTGETSSLLKRAKLVTGFPEDAPPEVDPSLKPTTGRFLALKAASRTGSQPALKPGTGTQPALKPGTGTQPAFKPNELQNEIRQRARHDAAVAPPPGAKPARPVKPPLAAEDTFVKKKIRQAENNLPDWDFDEDEDG